MYSPEEISLLSNCKLCPRNCNANRFSNKPGYCKSDAAIRISSICVHKGEEPVISGEKGICNVFFPHCNLQCIYCQNHEISKNDLPLAGSGLSLELVIEHICKMLDKTENILGFVSPSHYIPQMISIIRGLHQAGRKPIIVYNTNGYDKVETLRMLEGIVDIFLTDFKYVSSELAHHYSNAKNYPEVVALALKEMYRQKGSTLIVSDEGLAESGIIVRHLILPGEATQSIQVLKHIAEELSIKLHISLMSQYFPTSMVSEYPVLRRCITADEYRLVTNAFHSLGFQRGWLQDLKSQNVYRPDFSNDQPFEM